MATVNQARFTIDGTPSEDPITGDQGYVAAFAQTLDCTLETSPSSALSVTYSIYDPTDTSSPLASYGAPSLTWVGSGLSRETLANPNGTAQIIMPGAGVVSFVIRCTATFSDTTHIFERLVAIPAVTVPTVRKTVPAEVDQFYARGWSDEQNKMVDALMGVVVPVGIHAFGSAGTYQAAWVIDAGGGMVNIAAGTGWLRTTASVTGTLVAVTWLASAGNVIPAGSTRYVGVEYNGGAPQVVSRAANTFNGLNDFLLATVYNEAGTLHILEHEQATIDGIHGCYSRFYNNFPMSRDERAGGLIVGDTGVRNLTMTTGFLYDGLTRLTIAAIDTSGPDRFDYYYRDGAGGWTKVAAQSQYSSASYDNNTGALQPLAPAGYGITWWYLESDGHVVGLYGWGSYASLSAAEDATPPSSVPGRITSHGMLLGRTIVLVGAVSATEVESAFSVEFGLTAVVNHNSLGGLQGGSAGERYHLTAAQYTDLTDGGLCTSHVHSLDQTYRAAVATVTVDTHDVTWNVTGAFSFVTNLAGCTGAVDGFYVEDGTDYFRLNHKGADTLAFVAQVSDFQLDAAGGISLDAATTSNFSLSATSAGVETIQIHCHQAGAGTGNIGITADDDVGITATAGTLTLRGLGPLIGNGVVIDADVGGGAISIGCNAGTNQVGIGAAGVRSIYIGSTVAASLVQAAEQISSSISVNDAAIHTIGFSSLNAGAGTATITFLADDAITLDSTAAGLSLDGVRSSNFTITANSVAAQTLSISATNAGGGGANISVTAANQLSLEGTAGSLLCSGGAGVSIQSTGGAISVGSDANAFAANFGTGGVRPVTVGSATGASNTTVQAGTGVLLLSGAGFINFVDGYKAAGGYAGDFHLALSAAEYTTFEANFGEVSLLAALNACASTAVTLDEAYNAGTATIAVDAYDVNWNVTGAYSFVLGLAGCTGALDGFQITNGTDFLSILRSDANKLNVTSEFEAFDLNVARDVTIDSGTLVAIGTGAGGFTINTTQLVMDQTTGYLGLGVAVPSGMIAMNGEAHRQMGVERRTAANTAGKNLSIGAGGATVGATDKNGGDLNLASGISTGTGSSGFNFYAYPAGPAGIVDNAPIAMIQGTCALLTLGDTTGASATTIRSGTGAMTFTAGGIFDVNAVGAVSIDSSGGTIGIGVDAVAQAINIGTGAAARQITIGNVTTTTGVAINTGSSDFVVLGGNVGIGAAPHGILDVNYVGGGTPSWVYFNNNIGVTAPSAAHTGMLFGWNFSAGDGECNIAYRTDMAAGTAPRLAFGSFTGSTFTEALTVKAGQVGIGTATPLQRLNIQSGALRFDYVPTLSGAAVSFADGAAGSNTAGDHNLKFTAVNALGETELGTVSPNYTVHTNEQIVVSNCPISPDPTVTSRNVYASKSGPGVIWYKIAGLLPNNTTTVCTINVLDASLVSGGSVYNTTSGRMYAGTSHFLTANSSGDVVLGGNGTTPGVTGRTTVCAGSANYIQFMSLNAATYYALINPFGIGSGGAFPAAGENFAMLGNSAGKVAMQRHTTANNAGNTLSLIAGGATLLATDKAGGPLYLKPGQATGIGSAASSMWATPVGAAGTTTNDPVQVLTCGPLSGGAAGTTGVGILTTTPAYPLDVVGDVNTSEGSYYRYGAGILAYADTARHNYYFGSAGNLTTTGTFNTVGGDSAGIALAALAHGNTMWGASAGYNSSTGTYNVFVGMEAGYGSGGVYTGANDNVCVGYQSGYSFVNGSSANVIVGDSAGRAYAGSGLSAFGYAAAYVTTGAENSVFGYRAGARNSTGVGNTFMGFEAGYGSTNPYAGSNYNTAVGYRAGYDFGGAATCNALVGAYAGQNITTGSGNVCIGYQAGSGITASSSLLYIANSSSGIGSVLLVGDFSSGLLGSGYDATFVPSSYFDIEKLGSPGDTIFLELTNIYNDVAMAGTGTAIHWNQWYYDAATPAVADSGRIAVVTCTDWTSTVGTQDSCMAFSTCHGGTVAEVARLTDHGNLLLGTATFDATAQKVFSIYTGVEPAALVTDCVQLYSYSGVLGLWDDNAAQTGKTALDEYIEIRYKGATKFIRLYGTPA